MKKILIIAMLIFILMPLTAKRVGGVLLPDSYYISGEKLDLNGAGLRKKVIIKVYAGGLYLPKPSKNAEEILDANTAINLRMHFIYNEVDQEKLITAWNEGFSAGGFADNFAKEITEFNALFSEPALKGDIYDIAYFPEEGVKVVKNDKVLGIIKNPAFRKAVYSIWLGENTSLPKLKKALLED